MKAYFKAHIDPKAENSYRFKQSPAFWAEKDAYEHS